MPAMDVDVDAKDSTNSAPNSDSHNDSLDVAPSGIIIPPHEFRLIADKTADFVARTGPQFEERVREMERGNPKFCFLNSNDPYYAYYQWKIQQVKAGKDIKPEEKKKSDAPSAPLKPVKPAPKQPPPFEFILDLPPVSAQDLDIIKLTALFAARNGRIFMSNLSQKERNNYQFDFMRPSHSLSAYFTKLVDHYTKLLRPTKALEERLHANSENKYKLLDRIMERVEYTMYQEEQKKKAEEEADAERSAYNSIDWHDFVVVQTIEFVEGDENLDLPPPLRVVDLENMTLAQKRAAMFMPEPEAAEGEGDGDMEMEMEDDDDDKPKGGVPPPPPPNPAGYPPPPTAMPDAPPMMPPYGMPPPGMYPPGMYPPPPPAEDDGLESKRQRTEESSLIPEHIFLDTHGPTKQITISVTPSATNPPVQIVGLPLTLPVLELKKRVEVAVGMPASKQKLVTASGLPLRNEATLAFYNLKDGDQLRLMVRERGGRR